MGTGIEEGDHALFQTADHCGHGVQPVDAHRLQVVAQYGFHRFLPTGRRSELLGQTGFVIQVILRQPVHQVGFPHGGLLQRFQRGVTAFQGLQLAFGMIQFLIDLVVGLALGFHFFLNFQHAGLHVLDPQVRFRHLLFQHGHLFFQRAGRQGFLFAFQTLDAIPQAFHGLFQMLDAGLFHLCPLARLIGLVVEVIPLLLPFLHTFFGFMQVFVGGVGFFFYQLVLGLDLGQFDGDLFQLLLILANLFFTGLAGFDGLLQIRTQLIAPLLGMLDGLFHPGDVRTQAVISALNLIELVAQFVVLFPLLLDLSIHGALVGNAGFQLHFQITNAAFTALHLVVEGFPLQRLQLGPHQAFLFLELLVLLRRSSLAFKMLQLTPQLFPQIFQSFQVFPGAAHAVLGFFTALLVFGDARRLFDIHPQLFRLGLNQTGDHALFDDGVAAGPQAGAQEDVGDVFTATLGAVEEIVGLTVPGDLTLDADFVKAGVFPHQGVVAVIEYQLHRRLGGGLAGIGTVEDNIRHGLAPQVLGGAFPHHPAYRIDHVGLTTTVRADNRAQIVGKRDGGRVHKRFESGELDRFQAHESSLSLLEFV